VERIIAFQPPIPGPQGLSITAKTVAGRTFVLPCTATGVQPTLSLSHNKVSRLTAPNKQPLQPTSLLCTLFRPIPSNQHPVVAGRWLGMTEHSQTCTVPLRHPFTWC
jgi:hypothetical protein